MPDKRPPAGLGSIMPGTMDPSPLTTQLVWREVASLKELVMARLEAIETSIRVAHDDLTRVPTDVQKQVATLRDLHEEKFLAARRDISALEAMLPELNRLGTEVAKLEVDMDSHKVLFTSSKEEAKSAVSNALAAAKEAGMEQNKSRDLAVSKSETSVTKQIEGLTQLLGTTANAIEGKVSDLKDRITAIESKVEGAKESKIDHRDTGKYALAIGSLVISILVAVAGVVIGLNARP